MDTKMNRIKGNFVQRSMWDNMVLFGTQENDSIEEIIILHQNTKESSKIFKYYDKYLRRENNG